jgi:hypothetical protein
VVARGTFTGQYPADWDSVAKRVKRQAGNKCERCGYPNSRENVLTVHHLDGDKGNCEDWNLAALCQRCHLRIQGRVNMFQDFMFEHTAWMVVHVEGRDRATAEGRWPKCPS